jgi:hypothetical protein
MDNREHARQVMDNLPQSSADLEEILHKINSGQGTIGKLVNNPRTLRLGSKAGRNARMGSRLRQSNLWRTACLSSTEPRPDTRRAAAVD